MFQLQSKTLRTSIYSILCIMYPWNLSTSILSINCTDPSGHTPLHKACQVGEREMAELFIQHGALLDSRIKDNDQTPLHLACQYNRKDVSYRERDGREGGREGGRGMEGGREGEGWREGGRERDGGREGGREGEGGRGEGEREGGRI